MISKLIRNPIARVIVHLFRKKSQVEVLEENTYSFNETKIFMKRHNILLQFFEYPTLDAPNRKTAIKITGNNLQVQTISSKALNWKDNPNTYILFHGDQFTIQKPGLEEFIFEVTFERTNPPEFKVKKAPKT